MIEMEAKQKKEQAGHDRKILCKMENNICSNCSPTFLHVHILNSMIM